MGKETNKAITLRDGVYKAPPDSVHADSYLWNRIATARELRLRAIRLSQEDSRIFREVLDILYLGLFDLASGGIAHKIGLLSKLSDTETSDDEAVINACQMIGKSNFYVSSMVMGVARGQHRDYLVPSWFSEHFLRNEKFIGLFKRTDEITDETLIETENPRGADMDKLLSLSFEDLYCTYELAVMMFEFIEEKAPGIVKNRYRPLDHRRERDASWKRSPILSGLRERFEWPRHGQPNLQELLDASYQLLTELDPQLGFEEIPTQFTFKR